MSNIQLYSGPYITVEYRSDNQMIFHTIHQPIGEDKIETLKDALNAGTAALEQYGVCKWLSDDRKNGPLPHDFLEWSLSDWCPRTVSVGWRYWANVVPTELKAAGALIPVINQLHGLGLRMQVFTSIEDAQTWLKSLE